MIKLMRMTRTGLLSRGIKRLRGRRNKWTSSRRRRRSLSIKALIH
jgi:hypothetical protein